MVISQITGLNFSLNGDAVSFFDAKGAMTRDGRWTVNAPGGIMVDMVRWSIKEPVHYCIERAVEAGNGDKIAMLVLAPKRAVVYYLEGGLNREHLEKAIEGPDFVDIPEVEVEGRVLTVHVTPYSGHAVAIVDDQGNPI